MALSKEAWAFETGSDAEKESLCGACMAEGNRRQAVKYCIDCGHLVCQHCVDVHRRFRQMKDHKMVDISTEDDLKLSQMLSALLICPNHPDKTVELVCENHNVLCCLTCATVNHRNCKVVEVSGKAATTQAVGVTSELKNHLKAAKSHMGEIVKKHEDSKSEFAELVQSIPMQVRKLKTAVDMMFESLEQKVRAESIAKKENHRTESEKEIGKWSKLIASAAEADKLLTSVQQNGSDTHVYVVVNKIQKLLAEIDGAIKTQGFSVVDSKIVFRESETLQTLLRGGFINLGQLDFTRKKVPLPGYKYVSGMAALSIAESR